MWLLKQLFMISYKWCDNHQYSCQLLDKHKYIWQFCWWHENTEHSVQLGVTNVLAWLGSESWTGLGLITDTCYVSRWSSGWLKLLHGYCLCLSHQLYSSHLIMMLSTKHSNVFVVLLWIILEDSTHLKFFSRLWFYCFRTEHYMQEQE